MKKMVNIFLVLILSTISIKIYSQAHNPVINKSDSSDVSFGIGAGINLSGVTAVISGTYHVSDDWGVCIHYKMNFIKAKNLPEDVNSVNTNLIPPHDNINILSLNLCKEFAANHRKLKFGVEGGPAYILYRLTNFKINPHYNTSGGEFSFDNLFVNKFVKSSDFYSSVGLSLKVRARYYLMEGVGFETALFANINVYKPIVGLEFCVPFRLPAGK